MDEDNYPPDLTGVSKKLLFGGRDITIPGEVRGWKKERNRGKQYRRKELRKLYGADGQSTELQDAYNYLYRITLTLQHIIKSGSSTSNRYVSKRKIKEIAGKSFSCEKLFRMFESKEHGHDLQDAYNHLHEWAVPMQRMVSEKHKDNSRTAEINWVINNRLSSMCNAYLQGQSQ